MLIRSNKNHKELSWMLKTARFIVTHVSMDWCPAHQIQYMTCSPQLMVWQGRGNINTEAERSENARGKQQVCLLLGVAHTDVR